MLSLPALREFADLTVNRIDPEAVERRRRAAEQDRRVTFRPEEDGMAAAFALLPAHDNQELSARVDYIAGTACADDPRTLPQRYADGLMQLTRGYSTLGCQCKTTDCRYREARYHGESDADGVITRFITMINVVVNEKDLAATEVAVDAGEPGPDGEEVIGATATDRARGSEGVGGGRSEDGGGALAYLVGHGPITTMHARDLAARDLAARDDAKVRPFGRRITDAPVEEAVPEATDGAEYAEPADGARGASDFAFACAFAEIICHLEGHSGPWDEDLGEGPDDPGPNGSGPGGSGPGGIGPGGSAPGRGSTPGEGPDGGSAFGGVLPDAGPPLGEGRPVDSRSPDAEDPGASGGRGSARALVRARGSAGYRPSADLRRYLRLVFPRCVFPFCNLPASRAQIDHRREFDHRAPELGGRTSAEDIQPLCVAHHQLKTAGDWIDARLSDGRILWTSPDGRRSIVDPHGVVLQLFPDLARIEWLVPESAPSVDSAAGTPAPGGRSRLQREHARRERLRRRNVAALEAEQALENRPRSDVEVAISVALGAPRTRFRAPSFDGPPPY